MEKRKRNILENIKEYGCSIIHVMGNNESPRFSYSIGIEQCTGNPELIVTGLKQDLAHSIINDYNSSLREGKTFEPNEFYEDFLEGFKSTFKLVDKKHYPGYLGGAEWYYKGEGFRVFQFIYPSTSGVWPWDENAPDDFTWYIPKLYED